MIIHLLFVYKKWKSIWHYLEIPPYQSINIHKTLCKLCEKKQQKTSGLVNNPNTRKKEKKEKKKCTTQKKRKKKTTVNATFPVTDFKEILI